MDYGAEYKLLKAEMKSARRYALISVGLALLSALFLIMFFIAKYK